MTEDSPAAPDGSRIGPALERPSCRDFEPTDYTAWKARVEEELGSRPFASLVAKTLGGLAIEPLYHEGSGTVEPAMPGLPPYRRGGRLAGGASPWHISQEVIEVRSLRDDLARGVDTLWLCFDRSQRLAEATEPYGDGVVAANVDDLLGLLGEVDLGKIQVVLDAGGATPAVVALLLAAAGRQGSSWRGLAGCWGFDPLATLARDGRLALGLDTLWPAMADLVAWSARETPEMRSILVSTRPYHDAAASVVDEVAMALATGVEYLRRLAAEGVSTDQAARQMMFSLSIGRDLFPEIAKLRALRLLWGRLVERAGGDPGTATMVLHGRASAATLTTREPWLNLLRVAAEGFAAVLGGVDSLTLVPCDAALGTASELTRRLALQAHHLLAEEAHLGRVADPAGGSWAVESLTDQLARAAWQRLREIERVGGMTTYLLSGALGEALEHQAHQRRERVARRVEPIVGVSEFPRLAGDGQTLPADRDPVADLPLSRHANQGSFPPPLAAARLEELAAVLEGPPGELGERTSTLLAAAAAGASASDLMERLRAAGQASAATIEPLPLRRWAAPFEDLRAACDRWQKVRGRPPRVVLASLGSLAELGPRTDFAVNLFAAGGVEPLRGSGGDSVQAVADEAVAWLASGAADGVVICGSEASYREMAVELALLLKNKGARWIFLAGRPGDEEAEYRDAGIDTFIFLGCDVLAVLEAFLGDLEVIR